jgi:hypothetical protein
VLSMAIKSWLAALMVGLMALAVADNVAEWIGGQRSLLDALRVALPTQ